MNICPVSNFCSYGKFAGEDDVTKIAESNTTPDTTGLVLHWAARYDLLAWLFTFGREPAFRERILRLIRLEPGESVLDVGCGTGTLAIAAKRHVGPGGTVHGIDASAEMIARAGKKARQAGVEVVFKNGFVQSLPFPNAQFDAVLSTMMLHHLPPKARQKCISEVRRVLKPGGRVLAVDFGGSEQHRRGFLAHFHRHRHIKLTEIIALLSEAGLNVVESGAAGMRDLQFVLATNSMPQELRPLQTTDRTVKHHSHSLPRTWLVAAAVVALIAGHGIILYYVSSHLVLSVAAVSVLIVLGVIKHLRFLGSSYALFWRPPRKLKRGEHAVAVQDLHKQEKP
jgi:ubiquinone/menaquinone biosynthesis C-methylase UbiE